MTETTVLHQHQKQGFFNGGSGSIIGIMWHTATGEVFQIHFELVNIKLGAWPLSASHSHQTKCVYYCVTHGGHCIYLCSHDLSLAQKRRFTDIVKCTC